ARIVGRIPADEGWDWHGQLESRHFPALARFDDHFELLSLHDDRDAPPVRRPDRTSDNRVAQANTRGRLDTSSSNRELVSAGYGVRSVNRPVGRATPRARRQRLGCPA